jgi:hypothetical protein
VLAFLFQNATSIFTEREKQKKETKSLASDKHILYIDILHNNNNNILEVLYICEPPQHIMIFLCQMQYIYTQRKKQISTEEQNINLRNIILARYKY